MVTIEFSYTKLESLNTIWECLDNMCPKNPKQKAMVSVIQDLASRFKRKQLTLEYTYNPTSIYKVSLKAHEAYFFEMFLRDIVSGLPLGYTRTIVFKYADHINQKLA